MRLASWLSAILYRRGESLQHDPEKWLPVFRLREARFGGRRNVGPDHAQRGMIPKSGNRFSGKIMLNG
jgi:hypothetical protein